MTKSSPPAGPIAAEARHKLDIAKVLERKAAQPDQQIQVKLALTQSEIGRLSAEQLPDGVKVHTDSLTGELVIVGDAALVYAALEKIILMPVKGETSFQLRVEVAEAGGQDAASLQHAKIPVIFDRSSEHYVVMPSRGGGNAFHEDGIEAHQMRAGRTGAPESRVVETARGGDVSEQGRAHVIEPGTDGIAHVNDIAQESVPLFRAPDMLASREPLPVVESPPVVVPSPVAPVTPVVPVVPVTPAPAPPSGTGGGTLHLPMQTTYFITPPVVLGRGLVDKAALVGATVNIATASAFTDADFQYTDALAYTITSAVYGTGDPSSWASAGFIQIDAATGIITSTGALGVGQRGAVHVTVTATDRGGNSVSESFDLFVADASLNTTGAYAPGPGVTLGADTITGAAGAEWLWGDEGADQIIGTNSQDTIHGGEDNDLIQLFPNGSSIFGGQGDDSMAGNGNVDRIYGGEGNDSLTGGNLAGADLLYGGAGNDTLYSNNTAGSNITYHGQSGNDLLHFNDATLRSTADTLSGGTGMDTSRVSVGAWTFNSATWTNFTGIENFQLNSDAAHSLTFADAYFSTAGFEGSTVTVTTTATTQGMVVNASGVLAGHHVNVTGGGGADTLTAGAGNDTLIGGGENDYFLFAAANFTPDDRVAADGGNIDRLDLTTNAVNLNLDSYTQITGLEIIYAGAAPSINLSVGQTFLNNNNNGQAYIRLWANGTTGMIDGSGITNAANYIWTQSYSAGNDTVIGGAGGDQIVWDGNKLTAGDVVRGGAGAGDTFIPVLSALTFNSAAMSSFWGVERFDMLVNAAHSILLHDGYYATSGFEGNTVTVTTNSTTGILVNASAVMTATRNVSVTGGTGADTVYGGAGNDTVNGGTDGADILYGGNGNDSVRSQSAGDSVTMHGGAGNDTVVNAGTVGNTSVIYANEGDDSVLGSNWNDTAWGGEGNDTLGSGQPGGKFFYGEEGDDSMTGSVNANERLSGGEGNDTIMAQSGVDTVYGGDGNDTVVGDNSLGSVASYGGNDTIYLGYGADTAWGGVNDAVAGSSGVNLFVFNDPNESTVTETDIVMDFDGDDLLHIYGFTGIALGAAAGTVLGYTDNTNVAGGAASDIIITADAANYTFRLILADAGVGGAALTMTAGVNVMFNPLAITGSYVVGTQGNNALDGAYATPTTVNNDYILGLEGNDTIDPNSGTDTVYAGAGDDSVAGANGSKLLYGGYGSDTLRGSSDAGSADTLYGGAGDDSLYANSRNDSVFGETGNDTIDGGNGDDTAHGGYGDDSIDGGMHSDSIYGGSGNDTVLSYMGGGTNADTINAGDGNDVIQCSILTLGGAGVRHQLAGGDGNDTFVFSNLNQSAVGAVNRTIINDFNQAQGDRIDLSAFNGATLYDFIGTAAFSAQYQVNYVLDAANNRTVIQINDDAVAGTTEMEVELTGLFTLTGGDFVL